MVFNYYQDPGHGWIKTSRQLLVSLGIEDKITQYSYQSHDGAHVFLEEDLDASTLFDALKEQKVQMKLKSFHSNKSSKIRNYPEFKPSEKRFKTF